MIPNTPGARGAEQRSCQEIMYLQTWTEHPINRLRRLSVGSVALHHRLGLGVSQWKMRRCKVLNRQGVMHLQTDEVISSNL